jgi:acetylornithine deacetylase
VDAQAILARLVAFDTTSRLSNLALIDWVEAFLRERGIASQRIARADGEKANLLARIGPDEDGGVVLSGHTDVVPVDDQRWSSDPFVLRDDGERLYARGAADMKGFLALALAHVEAMAAAPLKRPIRLAFTYDEEIGCLGAPSLIAALASGARPEAIIVGEPTEMKVVSGHKGIAVFRVELRGREAHSSLVDDGVSAIMEGVKLMSLIEQMGAEARAAGDAHGFAPPGATMMIGQVQGGTALNILAGHCSFVWDLRCPPGVDPDRFIARFEAAARALDAAMKARAPDAGVTVTRTADVPACAPVSDSAAEQLARALTGDNGRSLASYAAEAGMFQRAGLPVVLCGPGSIAQAHQPDEWIAKSQLAAGARFMERLIARQCA